MWAVQNHGYCKNIERYVFVALWCNPDRFIELKDMDTAQHKIAQDEREISNQLNPPAMVCIVAKRFHVRVRAFGRTDLH